MILLDSDVLVYAFRRSTDQHAEYRAELEESLVREPAVGICEFVLSNAVRIVTRPRIFANPSSLRESLEFCGALPRHSQAVRVFPGNRHRAIFKDVAARADAKGNLVADAHLAALAIEHNPEWITNDRDVARSPNLRWRHPLSS